MNALRIQISGLSVVAFAAIAGLPVSAGTFSLPQGCEAIVTVQQKACLVSHIFTCAADPEGYTRRVDLDMDGMTYIGSIDSETQWIESFSPRSGSTSVLGDNPRDPASFSELLETGEDTYDFTTESDVFGVTRYIGSDRLTGETSIIDGVTLEQTEFEIKAFDSGGRQIWAAEGREFINRDWRVFLSGERDVTNLSGNFVENDSPVTFAFPGEAGFLASEPQYDCGAILSGLGSDPLLNNTNSQAWLRRS